LKLDHGNPNLMKKALRVNPPSTLASFNNRTGEKEQVKYRTGFVPSVKDPNAVPPPSMSIWEQPVYKSPAPAYVRPGADDFLRCKSRGF
jgi:hypothetical protein